MRARIKNRVQGVNSHEVSNLWLGSKTLSLKLKIPILVGADVDGVEVQERGKGEPAPTRYMYVCRCTVGVKFGEIRLRGCFVLIEAG